MRKLKRCRSLSKRSPVAGERGASWEDCGREDQSCMVACVLVFLLQADWCSITIAFVCVSWTVLCVPACLVARCISVALMLPCTTAPQQDKERFQLELQKVKEDEAVMLRAVQELRKKMVEDEQQSESATRRVQVGRAVHGRVLLHRVAKLVVFPSF